MRASPMVAQVGLNDPLPFLRFLLSDIGSHLTQPHEGRFLDWEAGNAKTVPLSATRMSNPLLNLCEFRADVSERDSRIVLVTIPSFNN